MDSYSYENVDRLILEDNIDKDELIFLKKTFRLLDDLTYSRSLPKGPKIELKNLNGGIEYSGYINTELQNLLNNNNYKLIFNEFKVCANLQILIDYIFDESLENIVDKNEYIKAQIIWIYPNIKKYKEKIYLNWILGSWYIFNNYELININFEYLIPNGIESEQWRGYVPKDIIPKNYIKIENAYFKRNFL